jgi:hypothetical protein
VKTLRRYPAGGKAVSAPNKKLVEDIASACGVHSLVIRKIVSNDKDAVAMLPVLFALLGYLRLFGEYPLDRLGVPFIVIDLLTVRHLEHVSLVVFDGPPRGIKINIKCLYLRLTW